MSALEQTTRRRRDAKSVLVNIRSEDMGARLVQAQEDERRRIGRELHDHVSQRLALLAIGFDQLHPDSLGNRALADGPVGELRQQINDISADIRNLSHSLHPPPLESLGLVPALQRLTREFSRRYPVVVRFGHKDVPAGLAPDAALCLFRVAEEGLTNAAKHGRAKTVRVDLTGAKSKVHLRIADDGAGFDPGGATRTGLGLVSMRERLELVGGTLHIRSVPSRGTRLDVSVPHHEHGASATKPRPTMTVETTTRSPHITRMVALIEERAGEHLSIRLLAGAVGRQEAYLGRLFRQQMGVSVRQYLTQVRMQRAAGMIRQGDKVEAVALQVGYRSKKNFYRQFIRSFGMLPVAYRKQEAAPDATAPNQPADEGSIRRHGNRAIGGPFAFRSSGTAGRRASNAGWRLHRETLRAIAELQTAAGGSVAVLGALRAQLRHVHETLLSTPALPDALRHSWNIVAREISGLLRQLGSGTSPRTWRARAQILRGALADSLAPPTPRQLQELTQLRAELTKVSARVRTAVADEVPRLNRQLRENGVAPLAGVPHDLMGPCHSLHAAM